MTTHAPCRCLLSARLFACLCIVLGVLQADSGVALLAAEVAKERPRLLGVYPESRPLVLKTASCAFAAFRDGSRVVCADEEVAGVWDITTGQRVLAMEHPEIVLGVAIAPDEKTLLTITAGRESPVRLWDLGTGKLLKEYPSRFAADGETLLAERITGRGLDRPEDRPGWTLGYYFYAPVNGFGYTSVAFSPTGEQFATGCEDGTLIVWNTKRGEETARMAGRSERLWTVLFSPDEARILTSGNGSTVTLWDTENRALVKEFQERPQDEESWVGRIPIAFSPDATQFAFYDVRTQEIRVCDAEMGNDLYRLPEESQHGCGRLAFVRGEEQLVGRMAHAHIAHELKVWDIASGKVVRRRVCLSGINQGYAYPSVTYVEYLPDISAVMAVELGNDENTMHEDWTTIAIVPLSEFEDVP